MNFRKWQGLNLRLYPCWIQIGKFCPPDALDYQEWWLGYGNTGEEDGRYEPGIAQDYQANRVDGVALRAAEWEDYYDQS